MDSIPTSWNSSFRTERQPKLTNPVNNPKRTTRNPLLVPRGLARGQLIGRLSRHGGKNQVVSDHPLVRKNNNAWESGGRDGVCLPLPCAYTPNIS